MTDYAVTVTFDPPLVEELESLILSRYRGAVISHHEETTRVSVPFESDSAAAVMVKAMRIVDSLIDVTGSLGWSLTIEELTD